MYSSFLEARNIILLGLHLLRLADGCAFEHAAHDTRSLHEVQEEALQTANYNIKAREVHNAARSTANKTVIRNVMVFDGKELQGPQTVVIENGRIGSSDSSGASQQIDGTGQTLMPGLIDSHAHPGNFTHLQTMTSYGVSTTMVMACPFPEVCNSLRGATGLTDVILGSLPVVGNNSLHATMLRLNTSDILFDPTQAPQWINQRISAGADFIKVVAEPQQNGTSQQVLNAATQAAHEKQKKVICHASDYGAQQQALAAKVDQVHHVPMERPIDENTTAKYLQNGAISVPTLIMMNLTSRLGPGRLFFNISVASVRNIHTANIPVLAGTDSNGIASAPARPEFGESLHQELEYLVQAGLSPIEALQAATSRPAQIWGLTDRGMIKPGMRADLVLVSGDPTKNISATRNIQKVWIAGHAYDGTSDFTTAPPSNTTSPSGTPAQSSGATVTNSAVSLSWPHFGLSAALLLAYLL